MSMQSRTAHGHLRNKRAFAWLLLSAAIVALDWWTKQLASAALSPFRPVEIFPWLNLVLAHNTGAAFSLLSDAGGWQRWFFTIVSIGVTGVLLVWLARLQRGQWPTALALGLVIGGAIGNLIDRLRLGYVVDFIDVHARGWHWPAFNVADSCICVAAFLLIISTFRAEQLSDAEEAADNE